MFARNTHYSGGAHRYSVEYHCGVNAVTTEYTVGKSRTMQHIRTVFPAHLYILARAGAMSVQVGQYHIVAHTAVHAGDVEHSKRIILIAVHKQSHKMCRSFGTNVVHMQRVLRLRMDKSIAQGIMCKNTVEPFFGFRMLVDECFLIPFVQAAATVFVRQAVRKHVKTAADGQQNQHKQHCNTDRPYFLFHNFSYLNRASKSTKKCVITQNADTNKTKT